MRQTQAIWILLCCVGCSSDPYDRLERIGAKLDRDANGDVFSINGENLSAIKDKYIMAIPVTDSLRRVAINSTNITVKSLAHVCQCQNIEELIVGRTPISDNDLVHIGKLKKLRLLYLNETPITDEGLKQLAGCSALERLNVSHIGSRFTGQGLSHLKHLKHLSYVHLTNNAVNDKSVAALETLDHLSTLLISSTELTDGAVDSLMRLKQLRYLDIRGTQITNEGAARIEKALPECDVISGEW